MDFDFYTKEEINAMLGGLSFEKISKEDYDALTTKDVNKVYFVYDNANKITMYLGETKLSSGTATAHVAAKAAPLLARLRGVSYTPGYPANICESTYISNPQAPSQVSIKPRGECLALLVLYMTAENYAANYNTIIEQGWENVQTVSCGPGSSNPDSARLAVFSRHSDGGEVYGNNYGSSGGAGIMLVYGAQSVSVVQAGNLSINTTYSYRVNENTERSLYGFTTDAPTTKKRVYFIGRAVFSGNMPGICTDHADLTTITGVPDEYNFTVSNGNTAFVSNRINMNFDDVNDNGGLTWFTEYADNPSPSYVPMTLNTAFATVVLDVNY